ncbi:sensor histidine kinase [Actinophytocola xanthii]|uniref:histidine kinase n=1 Tax=Actinophytocola xanthii TaxID=1912961 RepID=A0A1Q8CNP0_9PSEU|nr:histidine kinase [Actinophytocola xanthii]OLF15985.1 two-component sensor histidine kinase [Actinophytocola xanthii]
MFARTASRLRSVLGRWRDRSPSTKDTALALAVTGLAFVPTLSHLGPEIGDLPPGHTGTGGAATGVALTMALCLPLAVRTRWPDLCLAVVGVAFAADQVLGYPDTVGKIGLLLALYAAGAHLDRHRRVVAALATAAYVVLVLVLHDLGSPQGPPDFVAFYLVLVGIWLAGAGVRRWRMEEAERRRLAAEVAAAAERARIARDLHDVVTHHVTAMVVQADAAQFLLESAPGRAGEGLGAISDTGRRALTELRSLLGILEATGYSAPADREPTLGRVADLVERARLSGQPVDWTEEGERRAWPVDVELAVYRVVQEALTNALKYAAGQPTTVRLRHAEEQVEVEVVTEGSTVDATTPSGGRGLAGLRERVRMLGGELVAGTRAEGGYGVRALIPSRSAP